VGRLTRWSRRLWRILGSTRLTLILLVAMVLALLLASLFPQVPGDPTLRETWLSAVTLRYGPLTGLLEKLGLFGAPRAGWFLALLAALPLNTLICSVQRLLRLWRSLSEPPTVVRPQAFYQGFAHRAEWAVSSQYEGVATVQAALLRHRYRVQVEHDQVAGCVCVTAERGRWSQGATVVSHLAAVLLLVAVVVRPLLSWQEGGIILLPGQVHRAGHGTQLAARAGQPAPNEPGVPGYQVPLAILAGTGPVLTQSVGLNHPLVYGGVFFHLQGHGPAAQITAPEGTMGVALGGSQARAVTLPEAGVTLQVAYQPEGETLFVEARTVDGTLLGSGSVAHGQQIEIAGVPVTFRVTRYTEWQVGRDPTFGIAVASACLFLVASIVSLWLPHRRLWLRLDGGCAQMVGSGDWGGEFDTLSAEISHACTPQASDPETCGPEAETDG
jgi:cytochrome c biogenesis protein